MQNEWKRKIQKPIGVYVGTAIIFIKFGILNFVGYFIAFKNSEVEVFLPVVIISLALCLFTAGAAVWAFFGENEGRIALLILLPLNILWVILFAITALTNNETVDDEQAVFTIIQQAIIALFVIGLEWYFMSTIPSPKRYLKN
jgi:hypothetical protein